MNVDNIFPYTTYHTSFQSTPLLMGFGEIATLVADSHQIPCGQRTGRMCDILFLAKMMSLNIFCKTIMCQHIILDYTCTNCHANSFKHHCNHDFSQYISINNVSYIILVHTSPYGIWWDGHADGRLSPDPMLTEDWSDIRCMYSD